MSESLEKVLWVAVSLVILLIGLALLFSIFLSAFNPYDNIAFANTEKLRAAINEACINDGKIVKLNNFELRQNIPFFTGAAGIVTDFIPKFILKQNGDPNYVLYYEAFPPGEAVGWEVYEDHNYRLVTPFAAESKSGAADLENYATAQLKRFLEKRPNAKVDGVLINNVILNDIATPEFVTFQASGDPNKQASDNPFSAGGLQTDTSLRQSFYKFGSWKETDKTTGELLEGDNIFVFNNYLGLTTTQKSLIKYMACGDNALCLKTKKGVYKYPLEYCSDIKNVQIVYDARNRLGGYLGIAAIIGGAILGGKVIGALGTTAASTGEIGFTTGTVLTTSGRTIVFGRGASASAGIISKVLRGMNVKTLTLGGTLVYNVGEEIIGFFATAFLGYKTSDLNIASNCEISGNGAIEIRKTRCDTVEIYGLSYPHCTRVAKHPLYSVDKETGNLAKITKTLEDGTKIDELHYTCLEKLEGKDSDEIIEKIEDNQETKYQPGDMCIQIIVTKKAKGCWTPDPYKADTLFSDTQLLTRALGITPIVDSLNNVNHNGNSVNPLDRIIVLNPSDEEELTDFFGRWGKKFSWGWPWPFDESNLDKLKDAVS